VNHEGEIVSSMDSGISSRESGVQDHDYNGKILESYCPSSRTKYVHESRHASTKDFATVRSETGGFRLFSRCKDIDESGLLYYSVLPRNPE
jgi:hypothetical protein